MARKIGELDELIKDAIGGTVVEETSVPLLPPGENYGSVIYKVDFKVRKDGKVTEYSAVAKCPPPNPITQEIFNTKETFKSEIAWYTTVIPALKKFAKEEGLRRELDFFQRYYGSRISLDPNSDQVDLDGVLLTENLKLRGFFNVDRHIGFDAATSFSILKDLAVLHAVPLAIRLNDPALFEQKLKPFCPKHKEFNEDDKSQFNDSFLRVFDSIPELQADKDRIREAVQRCSPYGPREVRDPWTTILHLDFWANNVMVNGEDPSRNIILDFQNPGLGSCACDVVFFLFTSINDQLAKSRSDEFLAYYYGEFISNLEKLKVDVSVYSFEGFLNEIEAVMKSAEYSHILGHLFAILLEKGVSNFESWEGDNTKKQREPNRRQIEKFKWVTEAALKRNWI